MMDALIFGYWVGCLIAFIVMILAKAKRNNQVTLVDLIVAPLFSVFSWVIVGAFTYVWLEDNPIVIWRKKK